MNVANRLLPVGLGLVGAVLISACAPATTSTGGSGGATGSGGSASSGGAPGTGGVGVGSGGTPGTGGGQGTGGMTASGGAPGTGGQPATGGTSGTGGVPGAGGNSGTGGRGGGTGGLGTGGRTGTGGGAGVGGRGSASGGAGGRGSASGGAGGGSADLAKFSFFVASLPALVSLSGKPEGFGGDLRFGQADGLSGADEICRRVAEMGLAGAGQKQWRAFLSATAGPGGAAVNARDRIGTGPWYDRLGRLVSNNLDGLFAGDRPAGEAVVVNDLPNETGAPNHYVGPNGLGTSTVDNHDTLTGSDTMGRLRATGAADTCNDWTSTTATGRPWIGHSWPRNATSGRQWASDHQVPGCVAGVDRTLGGTGSGSCVGCSGGYGGFFCFALP